MTNEELAYAIDPRNEVGTSILTREQLANLHSAGISLAQTDDLLAASNLLRLSAAKGDVGTFGEGLEAALNAQPSTAENPNEDAYQRGRFDGVMEYAAAILALKEP